MSDQHRVFALTICGYRKPGMDEESYHKYISENHAQSLKDLMVKNKIIDYTMQHNTSETKKMMRQIFGDMHAAMAADYDCIIQMTFNDPQDFINVKQDPHYKQVVMPDHENFADMERSRMMTGWIERHIVGGQAA